MADLSDSEIVPASLPTKEIHISNVAELANEALHLVRAASLALEAMTADGQGEAVAYVVMLAERKAVEVARNLEELVRAA